MNVLLHLVATIVFATPPAEASPEVFRQRLSELANVSVRCEASFGVLSQDVSADAREAKSIRQLLSLDAQQSISALSGGESHLWHSSTRFSWKVEGRGLPDLARSNDFVDPSFMWATCNTGERSEYLQPSHGGGYDYAFFIGRPSAAPQVIGFSLPFALNHKKGYPPYENWQIESITSESAVLLFRYENTTVTANVDIVAGGDFVRISSVNIDDNRLSIIYHFENFGVGDFKQVPGLVREISVWKADDTIFHAAVTEYHSMSLTDDVLGIEVPAGRVGVLDRRLGSRKIVEDGPRVVSDNEMAAALIDD
ncbi:MAG: hypothetical protein AAGD32_01155 [Planctomycetota bacterium]